MDNKPTHNPIRCFEGDAKPHEPFWRWNVVDQAEPEMELYGYISEYSWWGDEITPQKFKKDLEKYGQGGPITIKLNSYGGDVTAASVISAIIRDYPGQVTVRIDGIAASAATVVAVAGDQVKIQDTAYFMIHDPLVVFFLAALNIEDLTRMADSLKAVKEGIMNAYETKTGLSRTRLAKMMTDETWLDAQRAHDLGFVDEILRQAQPIPIDLPQNAAVVNAFSNFANVPEALMEALTRPTPDSGRTPCAPTEGDLKIGNVPEAVGSSEPLLTEDMEREAQDLRERISIILRKE